MKTLEFSQRSAAMQILEEIFRHFALFPTTLEVLLSVRMNA